MKQQLLDSTKEMSLACNEVLYSMAKSFHDLHEDILKKKREDFLLDSGDLSYLERTTDIQNSLKELARGRSLFRNWRIGALKLVV